MDNNEYIIQALKSNRLTIDICARCMDKVANKLHTVAIIGAVGGFFVHEALKTQSKKIANLEEQINEIKQITGD